METNQDLKIRHRRDIAVDISGFSPVICPYLGSKTDRVTAIAYPHPANQCHRHTAVVTRQLQFQKAFCLSKNHKQCVVFQEENLPPFVEADKMRKAHKGRRIGLTLSVIIALISIIAFISIIALISLASMGSGIMSAILSFVPG